MQPPTPRRISKAAAPSLIQHPRGVPSKRVVLSHFPQPQTSVPSNHSQEEIALPVGMQRVPVPVNQEQTTPRHHSDYKFTSLISPRLRNESPQKTLKGLIQRWEGLETVGSTEGHANEKSWGWPSEDTTWGAQPEPESDEGRTEGWKGSHISGVDSGNKGAKHAPLHHPTSTLPQKPPATVNMMERNRTTKDDSAQNGGNGANLHGQHSALA
eukprot:2572092-Rhodomonas_salina.1